jgi:hypothetical protein
VDKITLYLQQIRHTYPELAIKSAILIGHGQFNDILQINDDLIFRFPRFIQAAEIMIYEVAAPLLFCRHFMDCAMATMHHLKMEFLSTFRVCILYLQSLVDHPNFLIWINAKSGSEVEQSRIGSIKLNIISIFCVKKHLCHGFIQIGFVAVRI